MGKRKWKFNANTRAMAAEYYCEHKHQRSHAEDIACYMKHPPLLDTELSPYQSMTGSQRRIIAAVEILNAKPGDPDR